MDFARTTALNLLLWIDRVANLLELGKILFNLYIDLSKAFDVLNHDKMSQQYYYLS